MRSSADSGKMDKLSSKQRYYLLSCASSGATSTNDSSQNTKKSSASSLSGRPPQSKKKGRSHKELAKLEKYSQSKLNGKNHSDDAINCKIKPGKYVIKPTIASSSSDEFSS